MKERAPDRLRSQSSLVFSKIPNDLLVGGRENVLKSYYRAQLRIARGQKIRAKEILNGLNDKQIFIDLEEKNPDLLAAIDIAVKKTTNRRNFKGDPIEPLFRLNHS